MPKSETKKKAADLRRQIENREKVYCDECQWFEDDEERCEYPKNIKKIDKGTWKSRKIVREHLKRPSDRNQYNDCKDHKLIPPGEKMHRSLVRKRQETNRILSEPHPVWEIDDPVYKEVKRLAQEKMKDYYTMEKAR